jgi:ATP-dependent Lon protease
LSDVKDRILEFLAVRQLWQTREKAESAAKEAAAEPAAPAPDAETAGTAGSGDGAADTVKEARESAHAKGKILLFAGPPGVGKTSIAQSIARAMGRKYVRISLGGARDEADIRGHRRTYRRPAVRIIQGRSRPARRTRSFSDEVDVGAPFGDPAARCRSTDPAQNAATDHYLGAVRLLRSLIATATSRRRSPVEVVNSPATPGGEAAHRESHLVGRQVRENGPPEADRPDGRRDPEAHELHAWRVRQLERAGRLARVARRAAAGEIETQEISQTDVRGLLGRPGSSREDGLRRPDRNRDRHVLPHRRRHHVGRGVSAARQGELILTGQLRTDEGVPRAAWTYARSHAAWLGIEEKDFERDVHIHVPAGAIPKDGPSAGIAMATAMVSALSRRAVRNDVAMTGEITISGRVLPIGGLKEKLLAALRGGLKTVLIPKENERDLPEIPDNVKKGLEIVPVSTVDEVLARALVKPRCETLPAGRPAVLRRRPDGEAGGGIPH